MTTVDHAHLDQLEAQSRRDHQTARQALAATDRQTLAAAPPPADMTDATAPTCYRCRCVE